MKGVLNFIMFEAGTLPEIKVWWAKAHGKTEGVLSSQRAENEGVKGLGESLSSLSGSI